MWGLPDYLDKLNSQPQVWAAPFEHWIQGKESCLHNILQPHGSACAGKDGHKVLHLLYTFRQYQGNCTDGAEQGAIHPGRPLPA